MSTVLNSVKDFLELVRKSGLIEPAKLEAFERDHLEDIEATDSTTVAAKLVRHHLLSNFQAKSLLTGKYKGFTLGAYRILEPLGAGGMSVVFLGEHVDLKRRVALKVLPANMAKDKTTLERFYREARAAASLDHPNIVRIFDVGQGGGLHYIVMEYVEGVTLHDLLNKIGPINHHQAAGYMAQAALGLAHAHEKGFVHRDIKPANLILDKQGIVKILDMGLAKSYANERDALTQQLDEQAVVGTVDIISPEQALNDPVDHRSDIYSLGATMFMLMSGKPPFDGTTAQKLLQHQMKDAPSLTAIRQAIPPALSKIVIKMMAKKPDERYQSAKEVIEALHPWLTDEAPAVDIDAVMPHPNDGAGATKQIRSGLRRTLKNLPPPTPKNAPAPAAPAKKMWPVWGAIAGGILIGLSVVTCWQAGLFEGANDSPLGPDMAKASPSTPKEQPSGELPKKEPPIVETPPKKGPNPPKVNPPAPNLAFFDATQQKVRAVESLGVGETQTLQVPDTQGWRLNVWKKESAGEWGVEEIGGQRLLWFRSPKGDAGMELGCQQPAMESARSSHGRLKVTYRTEGDSASSVSVRANNQHTDETHSLLLAPSPDKLRTVAFDLRGDRDVPLNIVFKNSNKLGQKLYISRVEMEPSVGQLPVIRLEATNSETFKETVPPKEYSNNNPTINKNIEGWSVGSWKDGACEVESLQLDGVRCLSLRTSAGTPTLQLSNGHNPPRTKPGRYYSATIEYRTEANAKATFQLRRGNMYSDRVAEQGLAPSEAWRTVAISYDATDDHPLLVFVQNTSPNGERLFVRSVRVTEETLDPKAAARILQPIDLTKVFNANGSDAVFSANVKVGVEFSEPGIKRLSGIPFRLPQSGSNNMIVMYGRQGTVPPTIPKMIEIPLGTTAKKLHFLGGVAGWGYPFAQLPDKPNTNRGVPKGTVSVIVRLVYANGATEDVAWRNGIELFDYNKRKIDEPAPKVLMEWAIQPPVPNVAPRQLRHLTITPKRPDKIQRVELMKGAEDEYTSPILVALTVER